MNKMRTAILGGTLASILALTGCGSDPEGSGESTDDTQSAPAGPQGRFDSAQLQEIQDCLDAAGLDDKLPDAPSGLPGGMPSDMPTDFPTDLPSDAPPGGGFSALQDPEVQEALEACGIEMPQGPGDDSS